MFVCVPTVRVKVSVILIAAAGNIMHTVSRKMKPTVNFKRYSQICIRFGVFAVSGAPV